jgi:uncharacterized protein (TIGR03067 family)
MLRILLIAALAPFLSRGNCAANDQASDLEKLQGRWKLTGADDSDGLAKQEGFVKYTLVVRDGQMTREGKPGELGEFRPFHIYPDTAPKQIDFKSSGKQVLDRYGVYSIEGDTLRICFSSVVPAEASRRPGDFTTKPGAGRVLLVFTRIKEDCTANARQPSSIKETKAKIRKLQQERVEVLNQALEVAFTLYREGALDFRRVHSVQQDLLEAQLDLVETSEAQIEVLKSQLKIAKRSLAVAQQMFQAGATTVLDVHQARSAMLGIEIRLLRRLVLDESKQPK